MAFSQRLAQAATLVEVRLAELFDGLAAADTPPRLVEAMRHAALGGGKRLRPFLLVECAALFGVPRERALLAGTALECVHCYSLVHDDLPSMDNDDLRRGQPTTHKAFDDATAILAGDGLLTFAFDLLSREETHPSADVRVTLVRELARASGLGGMVGGQMLDLAAEGRFDAKAPKPDESGVAALQAMKTGALIRFACRAGAILADADKEALAALDRFGRVIGQAYQIADDLLDVDGDPKLMGKAAGKDAAAGKATLAGMLGPASARKRLDALVREAVEDGAALAACHDKARAAEYRQMLAHVGDLTADGRRKLAH